MPFIESPRLAGPPDRPPDESSRGQLEAHTAAPNAILWRADQLLPPSGAGTATVLELPQHEYPRGIEEQHGWARLSWNDLGTMVFGNAVAPDDPRAPLVTALAVAQLTALRELGMSTAIEQADGTPSIVDAAVAEAPVINGPDKPDPGIVLMRGFPGSGKSTEVKAAVAADPSLARISRDDLRLMLFSKHRFVGDREAYISAVETALVTTLLKAGYRVLLDATNLNPAVTAKWRDAAAAHQVPCHAWDVVTPPEACWARNTDRKDASHVPRNVFDAVVSEMPLHKWEKLPQWRPGLGALAP